jgi:hypothetical protein
MKDGLCNLSSSTPPAKAYKLKILAAGGTAAIDFGVQMIISRAPFIDSLFERQAAVREERTFR